MIDINKFGNLYSYERFSYVKKIYLKLRDKTFIQSIKLTNNIEHLNILVKVRQFRW